MREKISNYEQRKLLIEKLRTDVLDQIDDYDNHLKRQVAGMSISEIEKNLEDYNEYIRILFYLAEIKKYVTKEDFFASVESEYPEDDIVYYTVDTNTIKKLIKYNNNSNIANVITVIDEILGLEGILDNNNPFFKGKILNGLDKLISLNIAAIDEAQKQQQGRVIDIPNVRRDREEYDGEEENKSVDVAETPVRFNRKGDTSINVKELLPELDMVIDNIPSKKKTSIDENDKMNMIDQRMNNSTSGIKKRRM